MKKYIILILLFSCVEKTSHPVALLGQWHLLSQTNTSDLKERKKLPQFQNQTAIFLILKEWIDQNKIDLVLAEGCEAEREIDQNFIKQFNGWNYHSLREVRKKNNYAEIMTHIPLKIKAYYSDQIEVLCTDDENLIKQHQGIFSDIRGYLGFYRRIKSSIGKDIKKGKMYLKALEENEKKTIEKPLIYLKQKIVDLVNKENNLIKLRNKVILKLIEKNQGKKIAVVVGYRHLANLNNELNKKGSKPIIPEILYDTLPKEDVVQNLLDRLKDL